MVPTHGIGPMANEHQFRGWIAHARPTAGVALHLICCPFAGGSSLAFRGWAPLLPPDVALWPVQLPGRGRRVAEPPLEDLDRLADLVFAALRPLLTRPHVLFGHSMGAALAYALARRTDDAGLPPARLVAVSARLPAHRPPRKPLSALDEAALLTRVAQLGGTPAEVLASPEMMDLVLPVLQADFQANDTYRGDGRPLAAPISAFGGLADETVSPAELEAWTTLTRSRFRLRLFPGNHFYLQDDPAPLIGHILEDAR
jgi:surfactin synthase thioesterase subunit